MDLLKSKTFSVCIQCSSLVSGSWDSTSCISVRDRSRTIKNTLMACTSLYKHLYTHTDTQAKHLHTYRHITWTSTHRHTSWTSTHTHTDTQALDKHLHTYRLNIYTNSHSSWTRPAGHKTSLHRQANLTWPTGVCVNISTHMQA